MDAVRKSLLKLLRDSLLQALGHLRIACCVAHRSFVGSWITGVMDLINEFELEYTCWSEDLLGLEAFLRPTEERVLEVFEELWSPQQRERLLDRLRFRRSASC